MRVFPIRDKVWPLRTALGRVACSAVLVCAADLMGTVQARSVEAAGIVDSSPLQSARDYFERGRKLSGLAAGATAAYRLRAKFDVGEPGALKTGRYEDSWISESEWRREVWFGSSHMVRSHFADKDYLVEEGPETGLLRLVMLSMEPLPAGKTMVESEWQVRRETVDGVEEVRVFRGPEGPGGELEAGRSQVYWFDGSGRLVKCYTGGVEIVFGDLQAYTSTQVARRVEVLKGGKIGLVIRVTELRPAGPAEAKSYLLKGHEWQRGVSAEVR